MAIPHHINEIRSDIRSIKPGWYAMDDDGSLSAGPFPNLAECVQRISKATLAKSDRGWQVRYIEP
jgi:hypothetical protein